MKKLVLLITVLATAFGAANASLAGQNPMTVLSGKISDENAAPVEYATVVLLSAADTLQVTGATSDSAGRFRLSAARGEYFLRIYYLGYSDHTQRISLSSDTQLPEIVLVPASTEMESVTVTARTITREADRFVVNIANNPVAIGKDAFEMLKASPGVWISKDKGITVNGKSGTRVMINDRLLRMDDDQLEAYLRSINAEDIVKIEIIPDAGAEYDADSRGGIIKITLSRQRNDGLQGSVGIYGEYGYHGTWSARPSFNINYQAGKLSLYGNGSAGYRRGYNRATEETQYRGASEIAGSRMISDAEVTDRSDRYNAKLGGLYDFNKKHSVGAEFSIFNNDGNSDTEGRASLFGATLHPLVDSIATMSRYTGEASTTMLSATANYIYKLDEQGSTFKLIADYNQSMATNGNRYDDKDQYYQSGTDMGDNRVLYRSNSDTDYKIASLNANFDMVFSPSTVLKFGGKYTYNNMYSNMVYDNYNFTGEEWESMADRTQGADYVEHVGALYAIGNARFGRLGIVAGLRGEYTAIRPKYTGVEEEGGGIMEGGRKKNYFDAFPNANISYALNPSFSNSLILSYSRKISRPGFWALTPFRNMLSKYSSIVGNPNLRPTYSNDFSLTGVLNYKYTLTLGAELTTDPVMQKVVPAEGDQALSYKFVNVPQTWQYYLAVNAPVTITEWWTLNANVVGGNVRQRLEANDPTTNVFFAFTYMSMNFSLPKDFDIEVSHYYQSRFIQANLEGLPTQNMNAAIKKRFAGNKFTASLGVNNFLTKTQRVDSFGPEFYKIANIVNNSGNFMTVHFSLRYNFQSGVSFKAKQVEKDSADDAKRLGGGQ